MNIIVCIKQVPDSDRISIDRETNRLNRGDAPGIINPFDENALELALRLKDQHNAKITLLSMGPPAAEEMLRAALALGADAAVLLSDRRFGGSDSWSTAYLLQLAIQKLGGCDLLLFGKQAVDGDTAQVGPSVAQMLDYPVLTYVRELEPMKNGFRAKAVTDSGIDTWEVHSPAAMTIVKEDSLIRSTTRSLKRAASNACIPIWGFDELEPDETKIGLLGSPTRVLKTFVAPVKADRKRWVGSPQESVAKLIEQLQERNLL